MLPTRGHTGANHPFDRASTAPDEATTTPERNPPVSYIGGTKPKPDPKPEQTGEQK